MKSKKNIIKRIFIYIATHLPLFGYYYKIGKKCGFEPGHFHSPIPDLNDIKDNAALIFGEKKLSEVDLNTDSQIRLLDQIRKYYPTYPYFNLDLKKGKFK